MYKVADNTKELLDKWGVSCEEYDGLISKVHDMFHDVPMEMAAVVIVNLIKGMCISLGEDKYAIKFLLGTLDANITHMTSHFLGAKYNV